jgi:hypothetical protein|tara:strand:- start:463 stop:897 length:435 start_codon:yes stop_codon:yes gene_type:complete
MKKILGLMMIIMLGLVTSVEGQDDSLKVEEDSVHAEEALLFPPEMETEEKVEHRGEGHREHEGHGQWGEHRRGDDNRGARHAEFLKEIGVTDEQLEELEAVRLQFREDMKSLREQLREAFEAILTEEQREAMSERKRMHVREDR